MFQTNPSPAKGDRRSTAKREHKRWGEAPDEPFPQRSTFNSQHISTAKPIAPNRPRRNLAALEKSKRPKYLDELVYALYGLTKEEKDIVKAAAK
jgi:hypothetical protein